MCEHDPQRSTRRMRHSQPVGRYNQLAAVGQSNRGGERPTVYNQRNKKHRTRAEQFRLRGERPRAIRFAHRLPHRLLLTLDVACGSTRHLPIVSQTGVAANHQSERVPTASSATTNNLVILSLARFNHHEHEIITPRRCFVRGFRNKHHRAIANSGAIPRATTFGLRPALGRQDSNARQSRTERDVVFAKDSRRLAAEDAGNLYTDAIHLGHVPCARRLLRVTRLCVRARRCSRPRQFRRRVRAVRK